MKHCQPLRTLLLSTFLFFNLVLPTKGLAQNFQRQFGTAFDNAFTKVIPIGTAFYVLGSDQSSAGAISRATVSRVDASGALLWTLSLSIASEWNDAVLTPSGGLLLVGKTLPDDNTNRSLMALVTSAGAFTWARAYEAPAREAFTRIVRNPSPQSAAFPYYVLGTQQQAGSTNNDVVLLNISESGNFNWKKIYNSTAEDNFARDLEALPNGDLLMAGNRGAQGVVYRANNTGTLFNGATPGNTQFSYFDVAQASNGGFYAVGSTSPNFVIHLTRFDSELLATTDVTLTKLSAVTQIWEGAPGKIYITGLGVFGGRLRTVLVRVTDNGGALVFDWVRYLDKGEGIYATGASAPASSNRVAYVDGRIPLSGGFGQLCAFMTVSDAELATPCLTKADLLALNPAGLVFDGPILPDLSFYDTPPANTLTGTALNWQGADVCAATPCVADFSFQLNSCGTTAVFTNTSTGPPPLSYAWSFGYSTVGIPNTSIATNPIHTFPVQCNTYNVCLTVTGNGCSNTVCKNIILKYPQNPVFTCPPNVSVACNTNITPQATGMATLTGACSGLAPNIVFSDLVSGTLPCNGSIARTWTTKDECGNNYACTQVITIRDNIAPTFLNCPPSLPTVSTDPGQCTYTAQPPAVTDNCDQTPSLSCRWTDPNGTVSNFAGPTPFIKGNHTIVCTAVDDCGNQAVCQYNVTVEDGIFPSITCPGNTGVAGTPAPAPIFCAAAVQNLAPTASDNCQMVNVTYDITGATTTMGNNDASGTLFMGGTSTVVYTVVDMGGNSRTCSFTVTVDCDSCACPGGGGASQNLVVNGDFSLGNAGFSSAWPYSTNCQTGSYGVDTDFKAFCSVWPTLPAHSAPYFLILDGSINPGPADLWITQVNLTPNTNYCFSFWWASVYPNTGPSAQNFPVSIDLYDNSGLRLNVGAHTVSQSPAAVWAQKALTFNSGALSGTFTIKIRQLSGTLFRDWGLDDICLTKVYTPCTAAFTPVADGNCGKYNFTNQSTGQAPLGYTWNFGDPMSGANNTSTNPTPMHQFSKCGTYTICLTLTAGNGCSSTVCHTVTVTDIVPPTALCNLGVGVTLNPNCVFNVTTGFVDGGSKDNCQLQSLSVSPTLLTGCGNHTVTLTATDWCGNTSTCSMGIQTIESTPPLLTCPPNTTVACNTALTPWPGVATATDNCPGAVSIAFTDVTSGLMPCDGTVVRTWTATDLCGNVSTCNQTVFVRDNVPPTIMCPPNASVNCQTALTPWPGVATATDNCAPNPTITFTDVTTGLMPCDATVTRTWKATDLCGNMSTCSQTVFVRDNVPPAIVCPQNLSVSTNPGLCYYTGPLPSATATDNCDQTPTITCVIITAAGLIIPLTPNAEFPKGDYVIRCQAEDDCGNVSPFCTYTLTVQDKEPPMITCPLSTSYEGMLNTDGICEGDPEGIAALVSDNCLMWNVAYNITGATNVSGTGDASSVAFFEGLSTVTYTVTDMGGNQATCSFEIFVQCFPVEGDDCLVWAKKIGGEGYEEGTAIQTDAAGNVYTTGRFESTVDFDPNAGVFNLNSNFFGDPDAFVSKLDALGNFVWAKRLGGTGKDVGKALALDASGNVLTAGEFASNGDFDPGPGTFILSPYGGIDAYVSKLDNTGNFLWARAWGSTLDDRAISVATTNNGDVLIAGNFVGTADFDPSPSGIVNVGSAGAGDVFLLKLDAAGNYVWNKRIGSTGQDEVGSMVLDAAGNIYLTGFFQGTVDFDPGSGFFPLVSAGNNDAFVVKLDPSGNLVWAKRVGGSGPDRGYGIAFDALNNAVYTTGVFELTADLDPGTGTANFTSAGQQDIYVLKLDAAGNLTWAKQMGGALPDYALAIAVSPLGDVFTTGGFYGPSDFDPGPGAANLYAAGGFDIYLSKLDAAGIYVWGKQLVGQNLTNSYDVGQAIAIDSQGCVLSTGVFNNPVDFNPGTPNLTLTPFGFDAYIQKMCPCLRVPVQEPSTLSSGFSLSAAYPNPFTFSTTIEYQLPQPTAVRLAVYDLFGREVAVLVDGHQTTGSHTVTFSSENLPSGTYFYGLEAGRFRAMRKLISGKW